MTSDAIEKMENSTIQHGKYNDRVYLMKLAMRDMPGIVAAVESMARERKYGKIFAKVPARACPVFLERGYREEGAIPRFFDGEEPARFLAK